MESRLVKKNPEDDRDITYTRVVERNKERIKRIFTIAYRVYPERKSMNIEYAASVFRNDVVYGKDETFVRKDHVQTARGRLNVRPLFATFPLSEEYVACLSSNPGYNNSDSALRKEERRKWNETEECRKWKETRRRFDEDVSAFLRRQISFNGVGAKTRIKHSELERARISGNVPHTHVSAKRTVEMTSPVTGALVVNGHMAYNNCAIERGGMR